MTVLDSERDELPSMILQESENKEESRRDYSKKTYSWILRNKPVYCNYVVGLLRKGQLKDSLRKLAKWLYFTKGLDYDPTINSASI